MRSRSFAVRRRSTRAETAATARAEAPSVRAQRLLRNTPRASQINPAYPVFGDPTTASVRDNFTAARDEIEALQTDKLDLAGGTMTGVIVFVDEQDIDGGVF